MPSLVSGRAWASLAGVEMVPIGTKFLAFSTLLLLGLGYSKGEKVEKKCLNSIFPKGLIHSHSASGGPC